MQFAFIGGGNMGRAMAAALVAKNVCPGSEILVVEPDAGARERLAGLDCKILEKAGPEVGDAGILVLAVKPQTAPEMFGELRPCISGEQVVVSIMAGVTIAAIQNGLGHEAIVRVMPNTPAQVSLGMNVYFPHSSVAEGKLKAVESLLGACGETLAVESEDAIDAATAVSGSGPAYVFFMAEHWMNAAQRLGFSAKEAELLIHQTLLGATTLWKASGEQPSTLRTQVTSKGGTTAAALEEFDARGVGEGIENGIQRAYQRAKELGS